MVLNPFVFLIVAHRRVVGIGCEERVGRCQRQREGELRTPTRVDGRVCRVTRQEGTEGEDVCPTILDEEVVPILHLVCLICNLVVDCEVLVGPRKPTTQANARTHSTEVLVVINQARVCRVVVGSLLRPISAHSQRVGFLATEPRLCETCRERAIICAVGLTTNRELLVVALGVGTPSVFVEEVAHTHIGKHNAE